MTKSELSHYKLFHGIYGEPELEHYPLDLPVPFTPCAEPFWCIGSFPNGAQFLGHVYENTFRPTGRLAHVR